MLLHRLLSNWVNRAFVNLNFKLDVGRFTLTLGINLKFEIRIPIFKGTFSPNNLIPVRPIFRNKA